MILVTGANGFIGRHFNFDDKDLRRVVRFDKKNYPTDFCIHSLNSETDWTGAFHGVDGIIHLAGLAHSKSYLESDYIEVNLEGTLHLAREAVKAGVKRFVFVSTILVNGSSTANQEFSATDVTNPVGTNAIIKRETEIKLLQLAEQTGLEVVIVRPTLVYGPNAPANFGLLSKWIQRFPLLPFGLAKNRRDFISVFNLIDLLILCAKHDNAVGKVFLASDDDPISIKEFSNAIAAGVGKRAIHLPIPIGFMKLIGKVSGKSSMIEQLFGDLCVDSTSLKKELAWSPPFTMESTMSLLSTKKQ